MRYRLRTLLLFCLVIAVTITLYIWRYGRHRALARWIEPSSQHAKQLHPLIWSNAAVGKTFIYGSVSDRDGRPCQEGTVELFDLGSRNLSRMTF